MHCWSCGAPNPNDNTFCGKCGKKIATAGLGPVSGSSGQTERTAAPEAPPLPKNPLVSEPRAVHDSPRTLAQMEIDGPPPPKKVEEIRREHSLPPNRITGPSFLGLSDEASANGSYLLDDEPAERSTWRAWLAVAVLALFGFLIFKHWSTVRDGAISLTQSTQQNTAAKAVPVPPPSAPGGTVSNAEPTQSAAATAPPPIDSAEGQTPPTANPDALDKPENDKAQTAQAKSDIDKAADTVTAEKKDEQPDDADAATAEKAPAKAATKRASPEEPQFSSAPVDEAERYLSGRGVAQDCGRAISLLRSSAREGNPRAQVKLGALYATGQCVTQDRAAAYQWLARAQETQPHNSYLQRTMNSLWSNMTAEERERITR